MLPDISRNSKHKIIKKIVMVGVIAYCTIRTDAET